MSLHNGDFPAPDPQSALRLVMEMMAIPGRSGQERAIAGFIRRQLADAGVPESAITADTAHQRSPLGGEVGNLIVKLPGTVRGPRRLMMAHIDTVPLCVGCKPVVEGDFVRSADPDTALGGDDRAGAAVVLNTALHLLRHNLPHPPLTLMWAVQEEVGLYGARYVSAGKLGAPKLCFNWDGGSPDLISIGATGDYSLTIEIDGIASHAGAHPEDGVSAIAVAALAIADLTGNGWHGLIQKGRRQGSGNIGVIQGGDATNVVTPRVRLRGEVRSHDPAFRERLVREYRRAFERAAKSLRNVHRKTAKVRFDADLKYDSFRLDEQEPAVVAAVAAARAVGLDPVTRVINGGLDANWMTAHGFPTVTLGCGQQEIHTVNERLHIPGFLQACEIGVRLATGRHQP